jgi:peroxiredoxin/mono/diheme cytochrome c family protein
MKKIVSLLGLIGVLSGFSLSFAHTNDKATSVVGRKIADFSIPDAAGVAVDSGKFKDAKVLVVVFVGTECPISNAYLPRLAELSKQYASQGVQFLAINSNRQDTPAKVAEHAKANGLPFPVLKDAGNRVADLFGAQRTPTAFVLDAQRIIRYDGRIDDQFGAGFKRSTPTRRDLAIALDELLAGKEIAQAETQVMSCFIGRVAKTKSGGEITYARQVSRILQQNCQECHREGQIGPMSLASYDDAVAWSDTIREVLRDGRMPPWFADPRFGHFANDRSLSSADRTTLVSWIDSGMARGEEKDMPPARVFESTWTIGKPDAIFTMPEEFAVPADMPKRGIPYQRFRVSTGFKEDRWIECAEARAGANQVVHHIIVYAVPPDEEFFPGNPKTPVLTGTAPGDMPLVLPAGMAKKLPAGSDLLFEMHYTPNGVAQKDRSSVGFIFSKEEPKFEVFTLPVSNPSFKIPPGNDNFKVEQTFTFRRDTGLLLGFMPHMHLRGKDFLYEAVYPDGKKETLLSIPHYNFNWQAAYRLAEALNMTKGMKVHMVAHFDNSSKNPNNPDPTKTVTWGDQTWEEMMIGWIDLAYERKKN